jgi:hypothetical protein
VRLAAGGVCVCVAPRAGGLLACVCVCVCVCVVVVVGGGALAERVRCMHLRMRTPHRAATTAAPPAWRAGAAAAAPRVQRGAGPASVRHASAAGGASGGVLAAAGGWPRGGGGGGAAGGGGARGAAAAVPAIPGVCRARRAGAACVGPRLCRRGGWQRTSMQATACEHALNMSASRTGKRWPTTAVSAVRNHRG